MEEELRPDAEAAKIVTDEVSPDPGCSVDKINIDRQLIPDV